MNIKMAFNNVDPKRKILVTGSIPTENLPTKSHDVVSKKERRTLVRVNVEDMPSTSTASASSYHALYEVSLEIPAEPISIRDLHMQLVKIDILPWTVKNIDDMNKTLKLELFDGVHEVAKFTVTITTELDFTVFVYHWPIPNDQHYIYSDEKKLLSVECVMGLLNSIENSSLCSGVPKEFDSVAVDPTWDEKLVSYLNSAVVRHSIPRLLSPDHFQSTVTLRNPGCEVIMDNAKPKKELCKPCSITTNTLKKAASRKKKISTAPAKSKAPLSACGSEKLIATVKASRITCKQLEDRVEQLEAQIKKDGVGISDSLEKDILKIMGEQNLEATPHMRFFWQQQMKLLQSKKMGRRYHPQLIRFALSLHGKSPSVYKELRDSRALILPSERILRDYKNYFKPKAGINLDNIETLREKASSLAEVQRYVVIVMDEMKIQSSLVFDKYSGDLIGFVDLGDEATNYASLGEEDVMATHALAFLVRGMCSDLKHVIAYYFTENVTSYQLMSIFWKVVGVLELSLKLPVCATVNDGASPNRKFFDLHFQLVRNHKCDVIYKVPNLFALPVPRFIYFFADSCHLIKTARNCLYNSGSGSNSRLMWNNGSYLMFRHIADLFYSDQELALHTLPKLSLDHIVLTSYSKMKVCL